MPVTAVGGKASETFQARGQDVPAPQRGQVLPAVLGPCFKTKNQKPPMRPVKIRTSPSPLIAQGWRWPLQRSGDCRSSQAPRRHTTWSGCFRAACQTSLVKPPGGRRCLRTEAGSVMVGGRRCPRSVASPTMKQRRGYLGNPLPLGQQERARLMSWDSTVILPQMKTMTCDRFVSQTEICCSLTTININPKDCFMPDAKFTFASKFSCQEA